MKLLTNKHPLSQKADKLFAFLEEHKISIERGYDGVYISDDQTGVVARLVDLDDRTTLQDLPPTFEYNLVIEE